MERLSHGSLLLDSSQPAQPQPPAADSGIVECPPKTNFHYLFPCLQCDPADRLPDKDDHGNSMAETLVNLGNSMVDPQPLNPPSPDPLDSTIPSAYTYFGQFITHEVVFEVTTKDRKLGFDSLPFDKKEIPNLENARTTLMDLDSVYGPMLDRHNRCFKVPQETDEKMMLGIAGNGDKFFGFDLPRQIDAPFTALIGERRNDANLVTSQMHLAFLRAHNRLVAEGKSFPEAQTALRQHFQWLVVFDYLPRVVDQTVLDSVLKEELDIFESAWSRSFMPVEFSAAAFRFAHTMPRSRYNYNDSHDAAGLTQLFLPKPHYRRVLEEWIIDWNRFVGDQQVARPNMARLIDTRMVQPLFSLIDLQGQPLVSSQNVIISLGALDLLRGYLLGLPTGQAVARHLNEAPLSEEEIQNTAGRIADDDTAAKQKEILRDSGLSRNTPLWFYVLAEAAVQKNGACLGRVGSKIVAGVLIEMVRRSTDSILREENWRPTMGDAPFNLAQLFNFAGVLRTKP